jgi:hypothetical protein
MDTLIVENETTPRSAISWPGVLAGAAIATALSMALLGLGSGLGLSSISPWSGNGAMPETTKAATVAGIYLTVTAVLASAVGGYIAGRLRTLWPGVHHHEAFFRDTVHGVAAWAVATLVSAAFLGSVGAIVVGGAAKEATRAAVTNHAADGMFPALTDRLFAYDYVAISKAQAGQPGAGIARDYEGDRATADRILSRLRTQRALADDERQSLAVIVAARTGLSLPDAEKRVAAVEADARAAAETARRVAMQLSFWFVAAMFAGALAAGLASWEGGAVRDGRLQYGRY